MGKPVVVFGSTVVDLMARAPHIPVPGETIISTMFKMGPGGKGFNQAVAAFKSGADLQLVIKVGRDMFANIMLDTMKELGIDQSFVRYSDDTDTGNALIAVDEGTGQNSIVVTLGANETFTDADIDAALPLFDKSEYLLAQLEINLDATKRVIEEAHKRGVKVILNTAPIQPVDDETLSKCHIITPNEVEAGELSGIAVDSLESAKKAADYFLKKGPEYVIITLGKQGAYVASKEESLLVPPFLVEAVDTTGAGDAFSGGLLTALSEGKDVFEAAKFASAVAALSVQKLGTTPSMPTREEIDRFLEERR